MTPRLRALRLTILFGWLAVGLGIGALFVGPFITVAVPFTVLFSEPAFRWATGAAERERVAAATRRNPDLMDSATIQAHYTSEKPTVLDDDPEWGKLVEGRDFVWRRPLTAVQVTNSTPDEKGHYEKIWLRVPSRHDRQPPRTCTTCGKDIGWAPRTARQAIAWTFRLCELHYQPEKAS